MAKIYWVKEDGRDKIPVADGTYTTFDKKGSDMDIELENGVMVMAFYNSSGQVVTPSGGTVIPETSPIEGQWYGPTSGDASIDAETISSETSIYVRPSFFGPAIEGRVTISGVSGADYFKCFFWRY